MYILSKLKRPVAMILAMCLTVTCSDWGPVAEAADIGPEERTDIICDESDIWSIFPLSQASRKILS